MMQTLFAATPEFWKDRFRASALHFLISALIAGLAALLVFLVWYPAPFREISGGRELFLILVTVDVILGPLITLTIFNRTKPWRALRRDLALVGLTQLAALGYGMWTVFVARPVHLVFEYDRLRVVHAIEVPGQLLGEASPEFRTLPLLGPRLLALRPFHDDAEKVSLTIAAMQGLPLGARPELWQPYADARTRILAAAKPTLELKKRFPDQAGQIDLALARTGHPPDSVVYLPMVGRKTFWTVLLDSFTAEVLGYLPIDSF
ncbi:MAG: TfpX/TfpZ family type IV pilin accessory protein [Burkholderiales bacterium]